ncbi:MAG TPA: glycosyltransferase family 2 protein [Thermohalobaculum sp.]|nr:glycosyltransferase family 2 protein [Thermohalobaculum sp.]
MTTAPTTVPTTVPTTAPTTAPTAAPGPRLSIVVPMRDEAASVEPLAREIAAACARLAPFEAIFVNDGSRDATAARIAALRAELPWLREVRHARPCGQSAAIRSGVLAARAPLICTLDGDGQNPPAEIPRIVAPLLAGQPGLGLVAGERHRRADPAPARLASAAANRLRAVLLGDGARDSGCGLKAFPRALFLALPHFDNMHRYLPALVRREGRAVAYLPVAHRPRRAGRSHYTLAGRALAGARDLIGMRWLMARRRLPDVVHVDP